MTAFLFSREGGKYVPARMSRGPWDPKLLHGGPPAALLAHAIEGECGDPDMRVARLTIDLFRPVPYAPLELKTRVVREGRRIKLADAWILADGVEVARASGLMLRRATDAPEGSVTSASRRPVPRWQDVPLKHFVRPEIEGTEFYHARMEVRRVDPERPGEPMAVWMRVAAELFPDTPLSPLERTAGVSDFASAIGMMSRHPRLHSINADISIVLYRPAEGEWICVESAGRGDQDGIISSSTHLHDSRGMFGHAMICGMAQPPAPQMKDHGPLEE